MTSKVKSSKEINLSSIAICFTPNISHDKEENDLVLQTPEIPSDIKDIPEDVVNKYNSSPGKYPIILFLEKNIDKSIDDQKLKSVSQSRSKVDIPYVFPKFICRSQRQCFDCAIFDMT